MKSTKFILLGIGLLAVTASIYGLANGDAFTTHLIGMICGLSLC